MSRQEHVGGTWDPAQVVDPLLHLTWSEDMFFHLFLILTLIAATIHVVRLSNRSTARIGEILLVWVLVGYCGIPMMGFMGFALVHPVEAAQLTGFPPGSPFQAFTTWALLGMSLTATLGVRLRGTYLIAPALAWSVFFAGATAIHLRQYAELGGLSHHMMLTIFATHGMISVLLLGGLAASGVWRPLSTPTTDAVLE